MQKDKNETLTLPSYEVMRSIFYASIHEVKAPLNGVVAAARLLKSELDSGNTEYARNLLQMIFTSANNVDAIYTRINQLLKYENTPRFQLDETTFDFRKWLQNLLQSMTAMFMEKEISIARQVSADFPPSIHADQTYLTQVLYNILMNAYKFSHESTVVTVSCYIKNSKKICIEISDQGIGIPAEELPFIFKEYYQAEGTDINAQLGGMGIGLSIVKQLLDVMGGGISVSSEVGAGSTFSVVLPLNKQTHTV